jgi:hypothetical protein
MLSFSDFAHGASGGFLVSIFRPVNIADVMAAAKGHETPPIQARPAARDKTLSSIAGRRSWEQPALSFAKNTNGV